MEIISIIILITTGSNGSIKFTGVPPGRYRLRVVASAPGHNQSVIRRRVVIPEDPNYCTVNLIDEGTIINGSDVTVLFRGVGPVREFLCLMDRQIQVSCEFVASKYPCMHAHSECGTYLNFVDWIKITSNGSYDDCSTLYCTHCCTLYFTYVLLLKKSVNCIPQIDC